MKLFLAFLIALAVSSCAIDPSKGRGGKSGGGAVLVCHKGQKTLELPQEAAGAHIDHGDTYGPC